MSEKERVMTDPREALVALIQEHILNEGANECSCRKWEHWEDPYPERIDAYGKHVADAILGEFDVTPRGEGMTIQIGGRRAGKTQALAERVADEVMKRGGSATVTSLPPVEDLTRAMHAEVCCPCDPAGCDVQDVPEARYARAVLALLPGRTEAEVYREGYNQGLRDAASVSRSEAEVKAEALREAAPGCNCEDDYAWLNDRADRIEKEADRG